MQSKPQLHHSQSATFSQLMSNLYVQINDVEQAKEICGPILAIPYQSKADIYLNGQQDGIRSGRIKRRVRATFDIANLNQMRVPTMKLINLLNTKFHVILLYQHQAKPNRFDIYLSHIGYCRSKAYDNAMQRFVTQLATSVDNILSFSFIRGNGNTGDASVKTQMLAKTGYCLSHQLIDTPITSRSCAASTQSSDDQQQQVAMTEHGRVFDIHEFARGCIRVMENLIFFTKNDFVRSLQLETNPMQQAYTLRLLDHRPILQDLWHETMTFALSAPGCDKISDRFTNEQSALLFNCHKQEIADTFNLLALGKTTTIIQPHPVRALLDHVSFLSAYSVFDISLYSFRQYGINWLLAAYYVGKNFLTDDYSLTNNQGAICFNGAPGSGKSRISSVLYQFMNGFNYQDSMKGITEFQNYDIVSKSFIKSEEVALKRLASSDWKMLADIEVSIKCKVKNKQDVEVTKYVPVVITSNGDVHEEIIKNILEDANYGAAHRRWGFVRYFETWNQAHPELLDSLYNQLAPCFSSIYQHRTINHQLMNALIGCALTFPGQKFVITDTIIPYYTHCLVELAKTLFGQLLLTNNDQFQQICKQMIYHYQHDDDKVCYKYQHSMEQRFEEMCIDYIGQWADGGHDQADDFLENACQFPLYYRCLRFSQSNILKESTDWLRILTTFLYRNEQVPLYVCILNQLEVEGIYCQREILQPRSNEMSLNEQSVHEFDIAEMLLCETNGSIC